MLEYTGLRVRDLARARRFYCEGLGLTFTRAGRMAAGGQWEELKDPVSGQILELNFYPDQPPYREGDELDHLGFQVEDMEGTIERLEAMGAQVRIAPFQEGSVRLAFLSDPDGIWVELESRSATDNAPASREGD
ncbi:MAG: VOC family protein [Thermoplasmata archaeon]|nr:VOC family protein [Thermoplasmata archaeon]